MEAMPAPDHLLSPRIVRVGLAVVVLTTSASMAATQDGECREPQACSERALEARERGAYETFHDLAWRAVQTSRPDDPAVLYLLARAQALSGRRRDAAITLRRLAEAGVPNDAATHEDFRRVRELPDWPYIQTLAARIRSTEPERRSNEPERKADVAATPPAVTPRPTSVVAAPPPPAAAPPPAVPPPPRETAVAKAPTPATPPPVPAVRPSLRFDPARVEEAARFSTPAFTPGGLAYDAVSKRFLFGDAAGRRLFVVGEGSERTLDLVRADSAGFDAVAAIAIDARRGDLWVASTGTDGKAGAVHRLQLISGRALSNVAVPGGAGPVRLQDIAVTSDGEVFILDRATPRILVLRRGATAPEVLMPLMTPDPVSLAVADDGGLAYVAHADGITRIDLRARRATALDAKIAALGGFEFIRWHRGALVGSQPQPDGTHGLVRLLLAREGRAVGGATLIDRTPAEGSTVFAAMSGGDLYYLLTGGPDNPTAGTALMNVRVRRVTLP
jgi:hypothetical protein